MGQEPGFPAYRIDTDLTDLLPLRSQGTHQLGGAAMAVAISGGLIMSLMRKCNPYISSDMIIRPPEHSQGTLAYLACLATSWGARAPNCNPYT